MQCITLTTDFGHRDGFVGIMKGVILTRAPRALLIDVSHEIAPGDVRAGAFVLMNAHRYFPPGTVHLAVVDPGVGSSRRALAVRTRRAFYVGPDNGVLSWAVSQDPVLEARWIENSELFLQPVSQTFHGRDIFAPVVAYLCRGGRMSRVGPEADDWIRLPRPDPIRSGADAASGEVLYVDRFGNAITNLPVELSPRGAPRIRGVFMVRKRSSARFPAHAFYGAVPRGRPVAVPGSSGFWELAVHGGSAADKYGLRPGDPVEWSAATGLPCSSGRPRSA
ncbi:MAG: SAM-dependent chlorinase/fluorinase [Limisphaera sp.]|nr:SAM-dependent chlorinase/fluorinase [Limisphaera sp.]